jgi:hypothetical protein
MIVTLSPQGVYHDEISGILRSIAQLLSFRRDAHDGFPRANQVGRRRENWHFRLPIYECALKRVDFCFLQAKHTTRRTDNSWCFVAFFPAYAFFQTTSHETRRVFFVGNMEKWRRYMHVIVNCRIKRFLRNLADDKCGRLGA